MRKGLTILRWELSENWGTPLPCLPLVPDIWTKFAGKKFSMKNSFSLLLLVETPSSGTDKGQWGPASYWEHRPSQWWPCLWGFHYHECREKIKRGSMGRALLMRYFYERCAGRTFGFLVWKKASGHRQWPLPSLYLQSFFFWVKTTHR
jgi:hypothetical protein